jgi:hypothetical protein
MAHPRLGMGRFLILIFLFTLNELPNIINFDDVTVRASRQHGYMDPTKYFRTGIEVPWYSSLRARHDMLPARRRTEIIHHLHLVSRLNPSMVLSNTISEIPNFISQQTP